MLIYFILLLYFSILGLLFAKHSSPSAKKFFLFLAFAGLFLLMAVRAETVGRDTRIYYNKFQIIAAADTWETVFAAVENAPVYCLLNKAVSYFGDYRLMMVVIAFITMSSVAVYIYHFSDNMFFSTYCFVTLYFYLFAFNGSRQFMGIALVLLSICFRKRKRKVLCVLFYLFALGIHSLSLVALPLLIFNSDRITSKKYMMGMAVTAVMMPLCLVGFSKFVSIFSSIFGRYAYYLTSDRYSVYNKSSGSIVLLAVFYLFVTAFAILAQRGMIKGIRPEGVEQSRMRYLIITMAVGSVGGILLGQYEAMARILYFYQIHAICLIPNVFCKLRQERFYYLYYLGLLLILLVPFTICLIKNFGDVVPYVPMWK